MSTTRRPLFTPTRNNRPVNYRGVQHARITKSMRALPTPVLLMLLDLRLNISDNDQVAVASGIRGLSIYFGYEKPNGHMYEYLDIMAAAGHITYTREKDGTTIITVLPPPEASEATSGDPVEIEPAPAAPSGITPADAPAPHPDADAPPSGDLRGITMNHSKYKQQQHDPTPTASALSASQVLLYNALRAAGADHSPALAQVHKTPDRTPDDVTRQLQAAEARPSTKIPIALLLHCWSSGGWVTAPRSRMKPPEQEESHPNTEKGSDDGAHQSKRPAARPTRARNRQRTGHDQIPEDFGFAEFFAFAQQFADTVDGGGGGDVPAV